MSSLSTNQLDVFQVERDVVTGGLPASGISSGAGTGAPAGKQEDLGDLPDFRSVKVYAETYRRAARLNAASVSDAEVKSLLKERQELLDKKFAGAITRKEEIRLDYVRWSLDKIEDAQHGEDLDLLEGQISKYEAFLETLDRFSARLQSARRRR